MGTLFISEHPVMRAGITTFFEAAGMKVEAMGWTDELEARFQDIVAGRRVPELLFVDLAVNMESGFYPFDFVERLRSSGVGIPVAVLSVKDDPTNHGIAVASDAHYICRDASRDELMSKISAAMRGEEIDHRGLKDRLTADEVPAEASKLKITPRECAALRLIACGLSNQQIARVLRISIETVKEHAQNIFRKLSVVDRTQAAIWAIRNIAA